MLKRSQKVLAVLAVWTCVSLAIVAEGQPSMKVSVLRQEAEHYKSIGKYRKALDDANEALKLQPEDLDLLNLRSDLEMVSGKYFEAATGYKKILERSPNRSDALGLHYKLAAAWKGCGHFEEALTEFRVVTKAQPRNMQAFVEQGSILRYLGRLDQANAVFGKAAALVKSNPPSSPFYCERARLWTDLGKSQLAIDDETQFLKIAGAHASVLRVRAEQYKRIKKFREALSDATAALKLEPQNLELLDLQSDMEMLTGKYSAAANGYRKILERYGDKPEALGWHFKLAAALQDCGDFEHAQQEYAIVLSKEPGNTLASIGQGSCLEKLGRDDQAIAVFERAARLNPKDPILRSVLLNHISVAHKNSGDVGAQYQDVLNRDRFALENEMAQLNKEIADRSTPASSLYRAYFRRAELYYDLQDYTRATADLDRVLSADPGNEKAVALRARANAHLSKAKIRSGTGGK